MTNFARIVDGVAVETFQPHNGFTLAECFHPDIAELFVKVPDDVVLGSTVNADGEWSAPAPVEPPPPIEEPPAPYELLTPMTLYMAFTPSERIAIKASSDPMVKEFWEMYQLSVQLQKPTDPNLVSVQEAIAYLARPTTAVPPGPGILETEDRIQQILQGIPQ